MNYFDSISKFFNKEANNYFIETQTNKFNNYFESSIFLLIKDILNSEKSGKYFIEIPLEELGALEAKNDYNNFIGFCECILNSAGMAVYNRNKENPFPLNKINDIVYKVTKSAKNIFIKESESTLIAFKNYRSSTEAHFEDSQPKPKLLQEFDYNSQNAERCIKNYFSWLDSFIPVDEPKKILNDITGKVLIISHGEIEKGELKNSIPFCSISLPHTKKKQVVNASVESSKDNYSKSYSTPIEPFIYLTAKVKNVEYLISKNEFETILVIGDKKFDSRLTEWLDEGYFRKLIYLGTESKSSELETYYKYSISELKNIYISENDQKPNIEDFILKNLNICNQVLQKGLIENNNIIPLVWQNKDLDAKISEFNTLLNEFKDKGLQFNFSPSFIYRYISEVTEEYRDKILNSFAEKMEGSLTFHDTEEITRSTVCDLLSN